METVADVFSIIAGLAAVITLVYILYDRQTRLKIEYRLGEPIDQGQIGHLRQSVTWPTTPAGYFRIVNDSKQNVTLFDAYLETNAGQPMPLFGAVNLNLPSYNPPGDAWNFYIPMQTLVLGLQAQGYVLSANIKIVVVVGSGNLYKKDVLISNLPTWAKGHDP